MKNFAEAQITIISLAQCDDILTESADPITTMYHDTNFGAINPDEVIETKQL